MIKLAIAYDGTDYHGFQRQKKGKTVQGTLEEALHELCQERITIIGAGRTDAGVHALGQVCHFKTTSRLPINTLTKGLNALLPRDIVVQTAGEMPADFHARYSATARTYAYFLLNRPVPSPFLHRFALWTPYDIDVEAMNQACRYLVGLKDFSSFLKAGSSRKNFSVHVREARCFRGTAKWKIPFPHLDHEVITFYIKADSFLYTMVRSLMGTLLEIGKKQKHPKDIVKILRRRDRGSAGTAVSPKGLFFIQVDYPKKYR